MSAEEEDPSVKILFNRIENIKKIFYSDNPPQEKDIPIIYKPIIQGIITEALEKINEFYNKIKDKDGIDTSFLNNTISLKKDIGIMMDDVNNINTNTDILKFLTKIENFKINHIYDERSLVLDGGRRRNQPKHADMTMKDIKELCKANQIKLSRVIDDKRVVYKKKELLTKLKRKKII